MVECTASGRYPERPRALLWDGKWLSVVAVEAQWRTPQGLHFEVRVADGRRFRLVYYEATDAWVVSEMAK